MKAQTFLEHIKEIRADDYLTKNQFGKMADRAIDKAIDFYSQPFKPELITELFKGWWYDSDDNCYKDSIGFAFEFSQNGYLFFLPNRGKHEMDSCIRINTLNDFISDCNRIPTKELEFKPEIIKEYFT